MMSPTFLRNLLLTTPIGLGAMFLSPTAIAQESLPEAGSASAPVIEATDSAESSAQQSPSDVNFSDAESLTISETESSFTEFSTSDAEPAAPVAESAPSESTTLEQIQDYSNNAESGSLSQVTSISQLSDVQPTDWAFQALQSLVERYGVIAGYPDGTYRGNRALTRYEFAAGLNAALDRVNELIAAGLADAVTAEDLATLQRLQEEFAAELATLRGRVDALEARTAELEANQFSTTTVLEGGAQFLISGLFDDGDEGIVDAAGNPINGGDQIVFLDRVRVDLITSFFGNDELETSLEAGNFENDDGNPFAVDPLGFNAGGDSGNNFDIDDLIYSFVVNDRFEVIIGAEGLDIDDPLDDISPLTSSSSGAISEFADVAVYEQTFAGSGSGFGLSVPLIERDGFNLFIEGGYVADDASDPSEGQGLFNGDYAAIGQLTFQTDLFDLGLAYVHSYAGDVGEFERIGNVYDVDGPAVANTYGGQVNFKLFDNRIQIGGGVAYSIIEGIGARDDFDAWSWQGTLAFPDFGSEGSMLGIVAGVPTYTRELPGQSDDTGLLAEAFYRYRLNDNIAITPSVIWISDPFNVNDNDDVIIGSLRTVFSF